MLATRVAAALLATGATVASGALAAVQAAAAPARFAAGDGTTHMPDQVLRRGCHAYTYRYALSPTTGDWQAEMFLLDPDRRRVSAGVLDSDAEPRTGRSEFWLCRAATRFGVFKIRGKLTTYDGWEQSSTWITPSYVWLHRWGR